MVVLGGDRCGRDRNRPFASRGRRRRGTTRGGPSMKRIVVCLLLAACRERGTIEVERNEALAMCLADTRATKVSADFILDGDCGLGESECGYELNSCQACEDGCTRECVDGCLLSELAETGIPFDPPSPGSYAVILRYLN